MSFSIINQKLVSSERYIAILKQIHAGKNWHVFCFQNVNTDPSRGSQQPDSQESPAPVTTSKTEPWSVRRVHFNKRIRKTLFHCIRQNLHCLDSTSLFLSHHNPRQHPLEAPLSQTIQNQNPKQLPNKTCEIHFYLPCQILSNVVQDTVSRNDRFGHR